MKLRCENFESTTSIGTEFNPPVLDPVMPGYSDIYTASSQGGTVSPYYEALEAIGMALIQASNDVHTIHINAVGKDFTRLHLEADEIYTKLAEYADQCLEMACEDGHFIHSINTASSIVDWKDYSTGLRGFQLVDGVRLIAEILNEVVVKICCQYDSMESDVQSVLDEWVRYLDSKINYFLGRMLQESKKRVRESYRVSQAVIMNRRRRKLACNESLESLKLGQAYEMFREIEDHIEDYNCDPESLKKGDYIVRDFQWGHFPYGGVEGYIPYVVVEIVYDRDEDVGGYHDARKRIKLSDGIDEFSIVCQNGRFNGMLHKLKKSSIK